MAASLPTIKFKKPKGYWNKYNERRRNFRKRNGVCVHCGGPRPCDCWKRRGRMLRFGDICLDCLGVNFHRAGCKRIRFPVDR